MIKHDVKEVTKMKEIVIATRNQGKISEFRSLFKQERINLLSLSDLTVEINEIEETGDTFYENAKIKAETVANIINQPVIADDSGLVVDSLDGRPGVYSARYAGEPTDDVKNYEKILHEMELVDKINRTARFVAVLALARPNKETIYFAGSCEGEITYEPQGDFGFGYDPIFMPKGYDRTMAQLTEQEKNKISHRYVALQKLKNWLYQER